MYLILTSLIVPVLFVCYLATQAMVQKSKKVKEIERTHEIASNREFEELQSLLYKTTENSDSMKMEDGIAGL